MREEECKAGKTTRRPFVRHFVPTFPISVIRSMWWYSPLESVTDGLTSPDMMVFPREGLARGS